MSFWTSRWVIVPGAILAIVVGWNAYGAANAGGVVEGRVVDREGRPVPGATVLLFERAFITNNEKQRTQAGPDGSFRFEGNASHALQLEAQSGAAKSERMTVRLLFRAQNRRVEQPLVLAEARR